ncbi:MAG: PQQ-binding-like beta-propeller repeat protein [Pirellulales bacterium]|nr:PQQ-binding-like beta-propeller repeat protein [Pirellulales bacterium]
MATAVRRIRKTTGGRFGWIACLMIVSVWTGARACGEDWPTYRHDNARSGVTAEEIQTPLVPQWTFQPHDPPQPAWGDPQAEPVEGILELRRFHFDDVFHAVAAGGRVYFGSSANGKVYALDGATGQVVWTAQTGGPVRLAPTVARGGVFVGSDDGYAYCLDAADGSVRWRFRAAPEDRRVLGHGKMISLWPIRTGVLVDGDTAYFGAGIFPAEGVFLYACRTEDGKEIWRNDTCGESPQSRISPQGYLLASPTTLYAPMGRVSPASFDRRDGQLKKLTYFGKTVGGTYALLADEHVYTGTEEMVAYHGESNDRFAMFAGRKIVVTPERIYMADGKELAALDRTGYPAASRKYFGLKSRTDDLASSLATARRKGPAETVAAMEKQLADLRTQLEESSRELSATIPWKTACACDETLILAGGALLAGDEGEVVAVDAATGKILWTGSVDGTVQGLAVANGQLLASTDTGAIHAFGPKGSPQHGLLEESAVDQPYAGEPLAALFAQAAEAILNRAEGKQGYCLVLGCENGALAWELARRSEWMVYVVEPDTKKADIARKALEAAGLLGSRVSVESWPLDAVPYSDYFADVVTSESAVVGGGLPSAAEAARLLKPEGGLLMVGQPAGPPHGAKRLEAKVLGQWIESVPLEGGKVETANGTWAALRRGPLPGAGSWTHLYANAANTACGDDQLVQGPMGVLWFGYPGPGNMVNRHQRAAGPLAVGNRVFVQGQNVLMAYDIYNGRRLWQREIAGAYRPNASHDGGNLAANAGALFAAVGGKCLRLEPATGATQAEYALPAGENRNPRWGWIACTADQLFGSRGAGGTSSDAVFAVDPVSGKHAWVYEGKQISHNSIAVDGGKMYFVDANVTPAERREAIERQAAKATTAAGAERTTADKKEEKADVRIVVCLDAKSGKVCWRKPLDLTHCGGGNLAAMVHNGVLVIFGIYLDGHYWQQFFAGEFDSRKITALAAEDGRELWSQSIGYRVRPLIIGDTLHAEPWAFDLKTGKPKTRIHPITGSEDRWQFARPGHHCGCPSASPHSLFFRSLCLGYYDLEGDYGTMHFGAQRPGCWINFIPAGGLLVVPEASAGCMCPFPNMCTVVFHPASRQKGYGYYSAPGAMTPVKRLAVNFGAAGDRNDAAGDLWLGYPRPSGSLVLQFKLDVAFHPGGSFVSRNSAYTPVSGSDDPWIFTSAAAGLRRCAVRLLEPGDGGAKYRVRLLFADSENEEAGRRVFDIKLQGNVVEKDFDIAKAAGGKNRAAISEFDDIEVESDLTVELLPKTPGRAAAELPILNGLEVIRQEITRLGCDAPKFLLNDRDSKQSGTLKLANLRETPFAGTIEIAAPSGFEVTAGRNRIELPCGKRLEVPVEVAVAGSMRAGRYEIPVRLLRDDGSVELERSLDVEHLGPRGRAVVPAAEDAYVSHRYPDMNKGSAPVMPVDGGDQKVGDSDHNLTLLKFRLDVPGRPLSARLQVHNAGNPTGNSGQVRLVEEPWQEAGVNYANRPKAGKTLAQLGAVAENQLVDLPLDIDLSDRKELSLLLDPTTCDGTDYLSRESGKPPVLIIEYEPKE